MAEEVPQKRGRGRTPGSKNKATLIREMESTIAPPRMFHGNCFDIMADDEFITAGSVNLVLCDPPFKVRRAKNTVTRLRVLTIVLVALLSLLLTAYVQAHHSRTSTSGVLSDNGYQEIKGGHGGRIYIPSAIRKYTGPNVV